MVLLDISSLVLVDGMVSSRERVIRCALKHGQFSGHGGKLGDEVDSGRASPNHGDAFAMETNLVRRPIGCLVPFASV